MEDPRVSLILVKGRDVCLGGFQGKKKGFLWGGRIKGGGKGMFNNVKL